MNGVLNYTENIRCKFMKKKLYQVKIYLKPYIYFVEAKDKKQAEEFALYNLTGGNDDEDIVRIVVIENEKGGGVYGRKK